jgi:hypothetical protein
MNIMYEVLSMIFTFGCFVSLHRFFVNRSKKNDFWSAFWMTCLIIWIVSIIPFLLKIRGWI